MKHSNIVGSSTAARRLACPGSVDLENDAPRQPDSSYAAEGTALHEAMEWLLDRDGRTPYATLGMTFYGTTITEEHVELLRTCMDTFDSIVDDNMFDIEQTLPFPKLDGAFGTGDVLWYADDMSSVGLIDWKFGAGVPVYITGNAQMKFLLCCMRSQGPTITRDTRMYATIVQPRKDYVETAEFTHAELDAFEIDLRHALNVRRFAEDNLAIGSHCQFCKAMTSCPAQLRRFDDLRRLTATGNDMSVILAEADNLKALIKAAQDQAHRILEAGGEVPGYKLVQGLGNRAWANEATTDKWLSKLGVVASDRREPFTLRSPAQMEKRHPELKERIATRVIRPDTGLKMVLESDKRPAVLRGEALSADFASLLDKLVD